ncbi:MAG TPA: ribosome biogenesis GTPase Der [Geminicoccaceae bacterium]|nr:ribosome biogenesis GTPase Der [Geminicoccaceae bacterium]
MPVTVAILGRPNVGKSTLFNRLVGGRRAIVDDEPGVTRDRIEGEGRLGELRFRIVDTAGIEGPRSDVLGERLRRQTLAALEEADLGLFLIDGRAGITPADQEVAELLRRSERPIILLSNKSEGREGEARAAEAWMLGLGAPIAISAEHGDGLPDLLEALRPHVPVEPEAPEPLAGTEAAPQGGEPDGDEAAELEERTLRLAIVGRPNVGKSSLVNRLLQSERMLTGPEPGLTRDSVTVAWDWRGRRIELVDTAGLRRRARIDAKLEKLSVSSTLHAVRFAHVVLLLVDATMPLEQQDLAIAKLVIDEGRALVLGVNKWDLVEDQAATMAELRRRIERLWQIKGVLVVTFSALTGRGVDKLLPAVVEAHTRWNSRIGTGQLNRWLQATIERNPPPLVQGRRLKIRYATQARSRPPTFALFANKPGDAVPESYLRYLAGALRESFDLGGVPLRFTVRHGDNPYHRD